MALVPKLILQGQTKIDIHPLAAENIVVTENQHLHARDDETLEESTIQELLKHVKDEDIQDIWYDNEGHEDEPSNPFAPPYPRSAPSGLGVLCGNGAIHHIEQTPFRIQELTTVATRLPFLHALIRREATVCKRDKWPVIVLPQQPDLAYRFSTVMELLDWLQGKKVSFKTLRFASKITRLFTQKSHYSTSDCFAATEDGAVYYWKKSGACGHAEQMNLSEALARPSSSVVVTSPVITNEESAAHFYASGRAENSKKWNSLENYFGKFDIPVISKIDVGVSLGAAVTEDGRLYVFSPRGRQGKSDSGQAHLLDLDDGTPEHRLPLPYMVREASISRSRDVSDQKTAFIDVAVGENHVVALQADGRVYTAGDAFQGQLGIGERQFDLEDEEPKAFELDWDVPQYCDEWQEISVGGVGNEKPSGKVVKVAAQTANTLFVIDTNI